MSRYFTSSYHNPEPYIPGSLSEIDDLIGCMVFGAPTFIDESDVFPEQNIDTEFHALVEGFGKVRKKLGEERYAVLVDLATRAKALFVDDPADDNGKTNQGRDLLYEMEDVIQAARSRRAAEKLPDDDRDISGD
ncbi:hypothetical protein M0208_16630 [Sphingomonas sp. SUN019]|uniref:hypothetical protein n=1 Tax=Sphingomonas sp. SUN019 TaxID=2937788 RepID=UPI002164CE34|nr:hypothetical protein [Sphingomonas sp. SUN019]UVO52057.1 hypothetical protein M0208_16630 [Sphingomonas sp. SUN019]